jgi:uncharacterized protein (TIGR00270 family)
VKAKLTEVDEMECELCGKNAPLRKIRISGADMMVCQQCAKFGSGGASVGGMGGMDGMGRNDVDRILKQKAQRFKVKDVFEESGDDLIDDVGMAVRRAREKKGLTLKELGMKINEREGVISKIETNKLRADDRIIKKLERVLGIKLTEKSHE